MSFDELRLVICYYPYEPLDDLYVAMSSDNDMFQFTTFQSN